MRRIPRLALVLVVGLTRGAIHVAAQDAPFGMNTRVLTAPMADKMVELGADVVRLAYGWDVIEPNCKGCFNWDATDAWRDEAKRTHRTIFASLVYAPAWANGGHPYHYAPVNYQDWYDFVYATVSRYRDDIHLWGVWNEPNLDVYLKDSDPRVYRSLVIMAHAAIRAASPTAMVLGPDVSWHGVADGWCVRKDPAYGWCVRKDPAYGLVCASRRSSTAILQSTFADSTVM